MSATEAMRDWIYAGQLLGLLAEDADVDEVQIRLRDGADRDAGTTVVISGASSGTRAAGDLLTRTFASETREVSDDGRSVEARILTFGPADAYNTTWGPETFAESLRTKLPAVCWGHDKRRVIGKVTSYRTVPDGLIVSMRLADPAAVPDAKMAASLLADGAIDNWSIGFSDAKLAPDPNVRGAARVTRARLVEVSPVLDGAVPGTATLALRARAHGGDPVAEALLKIDHALARSGGPIASTGPTAATAPTSRTGTQVPDVKRQRQPEWLLRRTATRFKALTGPADIPSLLREVETGSILPPLDPRNMPTVRPATVRLYFRANRTLAYDVGDDVPDDERALLMTEAELNEGMRQESAAKAAKAAATNREAALAHWRWQLEQAQGELARLDAPTEPPAEASEASGAVRCPARRRWFAA